MYSVLNVHGKTVRYFHFVLCYEGWFLSSVCSVNFVICNLLQYSLPRMIDISVSPRCMMSVVFTPEYEIKISKTIVIYIFVDPHYWCFSPFGW